MQKSAFTMIELIFVIVVIGAVTGAAVSRADRDFRQDASTQILQDIRYTQHLALMDNKTDPFNTNWQSSLWTIQFNSRDGGTVWMYYIGSNITGTDFSQNETAVDPLNGNNFFDDNDGVQDPGESSRIFLTQNFGIVGISFNSTATGASGSNSAQHVGFDYMGRPHRGIVNGGGNSYANIMHSDLNITFTMIDGGTFNIIVEDQTGAAYIDGQEES